MGFIIGIGIGDPGEQILIALPGKQVAIVQRFLPEIGQQRIAGVIDLNREAPVVDRFGIVCRGSGG